MKKLMLVGVAAVALCGVANAAKKPSLMRALGEKLVGDVPTTPADLADYTNDLDWVCQDFGGFAEALVSAEDIDMTYKFEMKLKVVENSGKAPKVSDFIEAVPAGVSYFASAKKTVKGVIWAKPRPSLLIEMALKSGLLDNVLKTNAWSFGGVESTFLNLAGALTDVRSVALWDSKARAYLSPTLFGMGGVSMGKDGKEAWGGFFTVFGANVGKLMGEAQTYIYMNKYGEATINSGLLMTNAIQYLDADVGLAFGVGLGKNNLSKTGRYIKTLAGNCSYLSTATAPLFDAEQHLTTKSKELLKNFTAGPFGVFYNVYTGKPYPVPVDVSLGFGTWKLQANASSIKKFAKCAGDQAKKTDIFLNKSGLPKYASKAESVPDVYCMLLELALFGDNAEGAKAYLQGRQAELAKLSDAMGAQGMVIDGNTAADILTINMMLDQLIKFCDDAAALGVPDTSSTPLGIGSDT